MAVRNLDAIERHGKMISDEKRNEYNLRRDNFWHRVTQIRLSNTDAVDAIDTIRALFKNGLGKRFEEWDKQQKVHYYNNASKYGFRISADDCKIYYYPYDDDVVFGWNAYGMCECYSTKSYELKDDHYLIESVTRKSGCCPRTYDTLLTCMTAGLQPYLDAFFKWAETI